MGDSEFVKTQKDGHLLIVEINRPERMNALHPPANEALSDVFDEFAGDKDLWVAIITGAGDRAFCAGNDLRWQAEGNEVTVPPMGFAGLTGRYDLDKPVIAAVNGVAMGGGFEVALACDLIIAADTARFALPEPKVGLGALAGGLQRLPRQIGLKHAMGMILTARHVGAAEGEALGFVNEVVAASELMAAARRWADMILDCSPMAIRASKQAVQRGLNMPVLSEACDYRFPAVKDLLKSADFVEGPKAFAEKRKPNWTNE